MNHRTLRRTLWPAWGIALLYVVLGVIWIAVSDDIVHAVAANEEHAQLLSTVKGVGYVLVTGALLYALIHSSLRAIIASNAAVRELEGRLRVFMRRSDVMMFVRGRDGTYLVASEALSRLYGLPQEEIVGCTDADLFDGKVSEEIRAKDAETIRGGSSSEREETLPLVAGPRTVSVVRLPIRLQGADFDAVVGLVSPVLSDAVAHRNEQREALERMMREESEDFVEALSTLRDELSCLRKETDELREESAHLRIERSRLAQESQFNRARLAQTAGRLEAVVAQMDAIVRAFDMDGVISLSEGGALGNLGMSPGDDAGRSIYDIYDEDVTEAIRMVLAGQTVRQVVKLRGQQLEARFAPVLDNERIIGAVVVEMLTEHFQPGAAGV